MRTLFTMLEERGWMSLNSMIQKTNQSIGLELYVNDALHPRNNYISYVRGKSINYISSPINSILHIQPPIECKVKRIRNLIITKARCEEMINKIF